MTTIEELKDYIDSRWEAKDLDDKKKNRFLLSVAGSILLFLCGQTVTAVWWAASIDTKVGQVETNSVDRYTATMAISDRNIMVQLIDRTTELVNVRLEGLQHQIQSHEAELQRLRKYNGAN